MSQRRRAKCSSNRSFAGARADRRSGRTTRRGTLAAPKPMTIATGDSNASRAWPQPFPPEKYVNEVRAHLASLRVPGLWRPGAVLTAAAQAVGSGSLTSSLRDEPQPEHCAWRPA